VFKRELGEVTQAALTQALRRLEQKASCPALSSRCRPWPSNMRSKPWGAAWVHCYRQSINGQNQLARRGSGPRPLRARRLFNRTLGCEADSMIPKML
jgi:hypothetical protein